ncbi:MAG: 16S rRNA (guanine(966)-N(2))-methyltransferase RsmD [Legionellales bacterium]|nr:16S rRNA (guanine(966)-N(2))-methyltransferase RsmD [Legionellales bacterium]
MGSVRIIGGALKGRRLTCPDSGVRPTPNPIRETLFNWLQQRIVHARCLDVFSGTGALGLEALSRGADWVTLWDANPTLNQQYANIIHDWKLESIDHAIVQFPAPPPPVMTPYDIVFLDPPFDYYPLKSQLKWLSDHGLIKKTSCVYFEQRYQINPMDEILGWKSIRIKRQGDVEYGLLEKRGAS